MNNEESNLNLQQFKLQKQLKELEEIKGEGTSLISLYIPAGGQIPLFQKMITTELGAASCIKSRQVRANVTSALTSLQQRLKLIKTPKKGLVLFCGISAEDQKKRICIIDPLKPLSKSCYLCDSFFHTEFLREQLDDGKKYGFIIVDGNGALFGQIKGNTKEVLHKFSVDLPKKHNKGGQSAGRFFRQCL